jgi:hypothetical protein
VPRQLLGDVQAGHPALHCLVGTLWPGALHFSCMLFGSPVVVVHEAPLSPISLRLLPYASQNPRAVHCEALLTTLCLKRQVISKRRVHSYVTRPVDDRLELSSTFFGQDFLGPAQSRVGSRETDSCEGEDDGMQDLRLRDSDTEQLAHM